MLCQGSELSPGRSPLEDVARLSGRRTRTPQRTTEDRERPARNFPTPGSARRRTLAIQGGSQRYEAAIFSQEGTRVLVTVYTGYDRQVHSLHRLRHRDFSFVSHLPRTSVSTRGSRGKQPVELTPADRLVTAWFCRTPRYHTLRSRTLRNARWYGEPRELGRQRGSPSQSPHEHQGTPFRATTPRLPGPHS